MSHYTRLQDLVQKCSALSHSQTVRHDKKRPIPAHAIETRGIRTLNMGAGGLLEYFRDRFSSKSIAMLYELAKMTKFPNISKCKRLPTWWNLSFYWIWCQLMLIILLLPVRVHESCFCPGEVEEVAKEWKLTWTWWKGEIHNVGLTALVPNPEHSDGKYEDI